MLFSKKMTQKSPPIFIIFSDFLIHIDVLMLFRKFELIPTSIFRVMVSLKNWPIFEKLSVL